MSWIDYTIIGVIGISMVISLFRGLIREVMALVVWVAAFWVAYTFADDTEGLMIQQVDVPSARLAIAFGLLFLITLLTGAIINFILGQLIEKTGLTGTDRFLGMFFGAARALVLLTATVMFAALTPLPKDGWWQQSQILPHFERLALWGVGFLPEDVRQYFRFDADSSNGELIESASSGDNTADISAGSDPGQTHGVTTVDVGHR